jgi:hypothetical protein
VTRKQLIEAMGQFGLTVKNRNEKVIDVLA